MFLSVVPPSRAAFSAWKALLGFVLLTHNSTCSLLIRRLGRRYSLALIDLRRICFVGLPHMLQFVMLALIDHFQWQTGQRYPTWHHPSRLWIKCAFAESRHSILAIVYLAGAGVPVRIAVMSSSRSFFTAARTASANFL